MWLNDGSARFTNVVWSNEYFSPLNESVSNGWLRWPMVGQTTRRPTGLGGRHLE